jgi:hypothetical protein
MPESRTACHSSFQAYILEHFPASYVSHLILLIILLSVILFIILIIPRLHDGAKFEGIPLPPESWESWG